MPVSTCEVFGNIVDVGGEAEAGVPIRFEPLDLVEVDGNLVSLKPKTTTSAADGSYTIPLVQGRYEVTFRFSGNTGRLRIAVPPAASAAMTSLIDAPPFDPTRNYDTVEELFLSMASAKGVDTIWTGGPFRYKESEPTASDHHVTTAGGVKLYVLPGADGAYNFAQWGVIGSGDETTVMQAVIDDVPDGSVVWLNSGNTYTHSGLDASGKRLHIIGYGATVHCTGVAAESAGFYKSDHDNKLTIEGITFTGTGSGVKMVATPATPAYDELDIISCRASMDTGVWGFYVKGGREPRILNCYADNINGGNGLYFQNTVSPFVRNCIFKGTDYSGTAILYDGIGSPFDAGLVVDTCEILGWSMGLQVGYCDWLSVINSTIDYNTNSIKLINQDGCNFSNNYLGSLAREPAIWITSGAAGEEGPDHCEKLMFVNNTFVGHTALTTYDTILIDDDEADYLTFIGNTFSFYTRAAIRFDLVSTRMTVTGNNFIPLTGPTTSPVYCVLGASDSGVVISGNQMPTGTTVASMNVSLAVVSENIGCITEAEGEAVAGSGVSTYNVAHGLAYTPAKSDIQLNATNAEAAGKNPYINAVDATNITIGFTTATAADAGVAWRARRN